MPRQVVQHPRDDDNDGHRDQEEFVALPPCVSRHVPGQMMMQDVGLADPSAQPRRVFPDINVFGPVDEAGCKIDGQNNNESFQKRGDDFNHGGDGVTSALSGRGRGGLHPVIDFCGGLTVRPHGMIHANGMVTPQ